MPKHHLFIPLAKDNDRTVYEVVEDYIKNSIVRAVGTGLYRPIAEAMAELEIADGSLSNTRTKVVYQIPPELAELLRRAKIASDLNAFVFRGASDE